MTHYLRDGNNNTILDLEFWTKTDYESNGDKHTYHELSTVIQIENYSRFLLNELNEDIQNKIVDVFEELSEYRGWLWESYYMTKKNTGSNEDKIEIEKEINSHLNRICLEFNLIHVTD